MSDTIRSLRKQLAELEENLRLIRERKAEYVLTTEIPLQLIKDERRLENKIGDLRERLTRYLSPPFSPVRLRDLPSRPTLHDVPFGSFDIGGLTITADLICHPGPTVGYRITEDATAVAYLPDHEPALGAPDFPGEPDWTSGFSLAAGVNLLIHDAQYSDAEYDEHVGWGGGQALPDDK